MAPGEEDVVERARFGVRDETFVDDVWEGIGGDRLDPFALFWLGTRRSVSYGIA